MERSHTQNSLGELEMNMEIVGTLLDWQKDISEKIKKQGYHIVDSGMWLDQDGDEYFRDITLENKINEDEFYSFTYSNKGSIKEHQEGTPSKLVKSVSSVIKS